MAGSKHRPNLSQSSTSSSEDGTTRASSSSHAQSSSSQPAMSRWERLRRPSAASSTKRPNFADASGSNNSSTVTSPTSPHFLLPSPIGGLSQNMMRTASDDSYMHILAASAAARRAAMESGAVSDAASISSFTCSLSKEFDRQRSDVATLNASLPDLPSSAQANIKAHTAPRGQSTDKKQAWLDTTFNKLSARYRAPKKGASSKGAAATRPAKPHFLDLSSIICPVPAHASRSTSTEDEGEAGDRSSSSSSSFTSGPDSSFEAMSGWDNSSADTSIELRTPQNEEDRQLGNTYDFTTPRPSQMQRFASAQNAALSASSGMRLPSPPLISPLMPSFALPTSGASTPGFAPPSANNYGFPIPPQLTGRGVTVDDIQHKPTPAMHAVGLAPPEPHPAMRQLRKQKSFDNPAELRRRQKQEWSVGGPKPPGFGGNSGLTIGIPTPQQLRPSQGLLSPQSAQMRSPAAHRAMLHNRVAEIQARPSAMQRGLSHDTAGASLQHHTTSPPLRPGLVPRASSSALRETVRVAPTSDIDPASSTGFSTSRRDGRMGSDRRTPVHLPMTSPLQSPVGGAVPLPPLLPASRESYSSVGTESLPPTPHSATFMRSLPVDERKSPREVRIPRELHQASNPYGAVAGMGSALGLVPGKMVRAYSDFAHAMPEERARTASRLRGESISSQDSTGEVRQGYATQTTPRQKVRPGLRREHTSNAILSSPEKGRPPDTLEMARSASATPSATITPRSSSLKDLLAAEAAGDDRPRASMDSEHSDSSLAYTKPSPLLPQGPTDGSSSVTSITPTNSYKTDLVATPTTSRWSPDNSPAHQTRTGAFMGARQRANSRADEWAAGLKKFTNRGMPTAAAGR